MKKMDIYKNEIWGCFVLQTHSELIDNCMGCANMPLKKVPSGKMVELS